MGSSPHTRGAPCNFRELTLFHGDHPRIRGEHESYQGKPANVLRIIPAYAGSTLSSFLSILFLKGSSPHTRGAPNQGTDEHAARGIIPAYAGSTWAACSGESRQVGSSPHTRGALPLDASGEGGTGIIPAYAGSTERRAQPPDNGYGSSPHTRGALPASSVPMRGFGIIPAYAGSTGNSIQNSSIDMDHPRIRGEHSRLTAARTPARWIIPAYAGSTLAAAPSP